MRCVGHANGRYFSERRLKTEKIESPDIRSAIDKYLNVGEWFMDQSIAFMGSTAYFERKRT